MSKNKRNVSNRNSYDKEILIKGMHCRSCEILIEEELKKIPQIGRIDVSHKTGRAKIGYLDKVNEGVVEEAIRKAGYEVGVEERGYISKDFEDYRDLYYSAVVLLILYIIYRYSGLSTLSIGSAEGYSSLPVVFLVGLTAGFSTCMALVGGLVLGISARHSERHPEATPGQKFHPHIFFNLGRIVSFFILGGFIGLLGSAFQVSGLGLGILTIVVGIVMILLGAQLIGIFPKLKNGLTLPKEVGKLLGLRNNSKEYSDKNSAIAGALTFFLPCGFTQAMQLYAISTGDFKAGALAMGVFAIGTMPGLLGVGGLTSVIKGTFARRFFKFAGLLVMVLAVININNGYNLTGWKINLTGSRKIANLNDPNVQIENGVQIMRMTQTASGYSPSNFTIRSGIPTKWIIEAKDPNACSGAVVSTKLGIRKILDLGKNEISFIPQEPGEVKFSCLMGMFRGRITVVENTEIKPSEENSSEDQNEASGEIIKKDGAGQDGSEVKAVKLSYSSDDGILPRLVELEAGKPARIEIKSKDDGYGCMGTVMIPGLVDQPKLFEKGKTIRFSFTPKEKGEYEFACAMGVPFGASVRVK